MGLSTMALALTHNLALAIALNFLGGFSNAPSVIARQLIIQRNAPRELRGRAASVVFVTRDVMWLIGMGMAGLADVIDVRVLMFAVGVTWVITAGGSTRPPPFGAAGRRPPPALLRAASADPPRLRGVPSDALRRGMREPAMSQLVLGKMPERLGRTAAITDLPRFAGIDQATAKDLRTEQPSVAILAGE